MSEKDYHDDVRRRNVLKAAGGALALAGSSGLATAQDDGVEAEDLVEVNVGFERSAGRAVAMNAAYDVAREFDFGAMTARVPRDAVERLRDDPNVRYVEKNGEMHALAQTTPWGIDRTDSPAAHDAGHTGENVDVAVIDSGIDANHEDLAANLGEGIAYEECSGSCEEPWDDDNDHGTHCAGSVGAVANDSGVIGVAPDVTLHAVKVLTGSGSGSYSNVAAGLEWAADQGYEVASLSLGGSPSDAVRDAVQYAHEQGVLIVAAAGNDGEPDSVGYPAAYEEVVAVSATNENDELASFSSRGPEVDIAAPGAGVLSTVAGDDYDELSGTSMACPHVAGAGALVRGLGNDNVAARQQLEGTAEDLGLPDNHQGNGLLDVEAAVEDSYEPQPPSVDDLEVEARSSWWFYTDLFVEWSVSDVDGDLATVETTLLEDGEAIAWKSADVGGESATGDPFFGNLGSGAYTVEVTVTDEAGNETTETDDVTVE